MTPPTSSTTDRAKTGRAKTSRAGFALFEMMLALALIALLAALALPRVRPYDGGAALRTKAYQAAALIRADRDAARRTDREVASVVDFGRRRIVSGFGAETVGLPDGVTMRLKADRFPGFRFFPDGRSSGGALTLAAGARELVVLVNPLTSAVEIRVPQAAPQ